MYLDALSFLEDERETFRAFEALDALTDEQLERPVEAAHGWSGRDLMGHLVHGQEEALAAAKEMAVDERSPALERMKADWEAPGGPDRINAEALERFRALPMDELRQRFREVGGELRGYLTVVPEARWIKNAEHQEWLFGDTTEHYEAHLPDLHAILEAAR